MLARMNPSNPKPTKLIRPLAIGSDVFVVPVPWGTRSWAFQQRAVPVASAVASVFVQLLQLKDGDFASLLQQDVLRVLPQALPYLGRIFSQMPDGEMDAILRTLLADATMNKLKLFGGNGSGPELFDQVMQGRTVDTWKLLWYAFEVWYPDVFTLAGSFFVKADDAANHSDSSNTSPTPGPVTA